MHSGGAREKKKPGFGHKVLAEEKVIITWQVLCEACVCTALFTIPVPLRRSLKGSEEATTHAMDLGLVPFCLNLLSAI